MAFRPIVAVPARNEEDRLIPLLSALAAQDWIAAHGPLPVVLVLNNCTDASRDAALAGMAATPDLAVTCLDVVFAPDEAHVGSARRLALETALERLGPAPGGVLLTTDADAVPAADWVSANLRHLADGIDLVGGRIVGNPSEEARLGPDFARRAALYARYGRAVDRLAALVDPLPHDPWPRHRDHTGASLAVRAEVYAAVGGMPALPWREDVAFVARVRRAGHLIRHPLDVVVEVSARLAGRAPGGMADCLKTWLRDAAAGAPLLVPDPDLVLDRLRANRLQRLSVAPGAAEEAGEHDVFDLPAMLEAGEAMAVLEAMIAAAEGDRHAA